jgi:hypothetical protein
MIKVFMIMLGDRSTWRYLLSLAFSGVSSALSDWLDREASARLGIQDLLA